MHNDWSNTNLKTMSFCNPLGTVDTSDSITAYFAPSAIRRHNIVTASQKHEDYNILIGMFTTIIIGTFFPKI